MISKLSITMAFGWLLRNRPLKQNHHSGHCLPGVFRRVPAISREHPRPKAAEDSLYQGKRDT